MPNDAHAAIGAYDGPLMRPIIEICAAGMLAMFQSKFAETADHGSSGQPHFLFSARMRFSFCRIVPSFPETADGGTGSDCTSAASRKYSCSASLFAVQYFSHARFASIQASEPIGNSSGSA